MKRLMIVSLLAALMVSACTGGLTTTESGLQYEVISEGTGDLPEVGDRVRVHYVGTLEDGTQFDSSRDPGREPIELVLGSGQVIPGWEEGLLLLNEGTVANLVIPPDLAYGATERPGIPANSTLNFEVELVEIVPPPPPPAAIDDSDYTTTESGLKYYHLTEGTGDMPQQGEIAYINYIGWFEDGTQFIDSRESGQSAPIIVGQNQVIAGWDEGVALMRVGGFTQFIVPPDLALGEQGGGPIPPDSTLIFELELVRIEPAPPTPTPAPPPAEIEDAAFIELDNGMRYAFITEGEGDPPVDGQTVTVEYTGWLVDGTQFDSSVGRAPLSFEVGAPGLIEGWQEAIRVMPPGSKIQVYIPADLAYGEAGRGPIPGGATLIFEMELLAVEE